MNEQIKESKIVQALIDCIIDVNRKYDTIIELLEENNDNSRKITETLSKKRDKVG